MDKPIEPSASDWPLPLMLDEVWLRARRVMVHQLERSGLWAETARHRVFMKEQKDLGERIKHERLREVLGPDDFLCANAERVFGPTNQHFRSKLPLVLAFGHELGAGLCALTGGGHDCCLRAAALCSLFNLGISIFDLINDHMLDLSEEFSKYFNDRTLRQLEGNSRTYEHLQTVCSQVPADELRILLRIISWFFAKLHELYEVSRWEQARDKLSSLLGEAYRAELWSARPNGHAEINPRQVSQTKSTLPSVILIQVAFHLGRTAPRKFIRHHLGKSRGRGHHDPRLAL